MQRESTTECIWKGDYVDKRFKQKLDTLILTETKDLKLKNIQSNFQRIKTVHQSTKVSTFLTKCKEELSEDIGKCTRSNKCAKISNKLREEGNEFYKRKNFQMALKGFSLSLCFAPTRSREMALAYSNRSACFVELGQYKESLADIQSAMRFLDADDKNDLQAVRQKLIERKDRCERKLTADDTADNKKQKNCTEIQNLFKLQNASTIIESAEEFVTIEENETRGRYVKVTKNVDPGSVLIVEEPYSKALVKQHRWEIEFCHFCFNQTRSPLPCTHCVYTVYCSENCLNLDKFLHEKYECTLSPYLHRLQLKRLVLLAYKTLIKLGPKDLHRLWISEQQSAKLSTNNNIITGFNSEGKYNSSSYHPINCLIYHDNSATEEELREYSIQSILIVELIDLHTQFFKSISNVEILKQFAASLILLHLLNFPCNAHSLNVLQLTNWSADEIRAATTTDFGAGAFALLSMINHSCNPNVTRVTLSNGVNAVISIRGLKAGDEVLDNYGSHYAVENYEERQNHLKLNYNFKCECVACKKRWPQVDTLMNVDYKFVCENCSKELDYVDIRSSILEESGKCNKCGTVYQPTVLKKDLTHKINEFKNAFDLVLENRPLESVKILCDCIRYFESHLLPPYINTNYSQETLKQAFNLIAITK